MVVYLVEDNPGDVALIRACLARAGHYTILDFCRIGDLMLLESTPPDVLLLDLRLPDAVEGEVIRRAQALFPEVPLVVLTGIDNADLAHECLEQGVDDYIGKHGVTSEGLRRAIAFAVARGRARVLQKRLLMSERLASLGRLAAGVAHEINNPATFVLVNLELVSRKLSELASETPLAAEQAASTIKDIQTMTDEARTGIERIASIVKELSGFSRLDVDHRAEVGLDAVVVRVCASLAHRVPPGICLEPRILTRALALGESGKLEQILSNLVSNAIDAMTDQEIGRVVIEVYEDNDRVVLAVQDTGVGIASDKVDRVFDPFFTTKPRGQGIGLGLAISAEAALQMDGTLRLVSTGPKGTRFELDLPKAAVSQKPRVAAPTPLPPLRGLKVLLIEDDDAVSAALSRITSAVHSTVRASSGEAALQLLKDGQRFDVILCDLIMPGMGGMAFFRELERHWPQLRHRVVLCSGGLVDDATRAFVESTGLAVLEKPVRSQELLKCIERVATQAGVLPLS